MRSDVGGRLVATGYRSIGLLRAHLKRVVARAGVRERRG